MKNKFKNIIKNTKEYNKNFIKFFRKNKYINFLSLGILVVTPQFFTYELAAPPFMKKDSINPFQKITNLKIYSLPYTMRVACAHYTKFEEIDLINGINIKLPSECFKKDTDISFRANKKLISKR